MPATFAKADTAVREMANDILCLNECYQPLLDAHVTIDFMFAYAERDEKERIVGNALTKNGLPALGIARIVNLKDRAKGMGDAEICLDHDFWETAGEKEKRALLDHELYHLCVRIDKRGLVRDDLGRPKLKIRKHDYEFGWFRAVAERNGKHSLEQIQAARMADEAGQLFWPGLSVK